MKTKKEYMRQLGYIGLMATPKNRFGWLEKRVMLYPPEERIHYFTAVYCYANSLIEETSLLLTEKDDLIAKLEAEVEELSHEISMSTPT